MVQDSPKMAPRWPHDGPKVANDEPKDPALWRTFKVPSARQAKMAIRWLHIGPKMAPKWPKMAPRWPKHGPTMAPRSLKMDPMTRHFEEPSKCRVQRLPRQAKMALRWLQSGFKRAKTKTQNSPQMASKWPQDGSKVASRCTEQRW